LDYLIAALHFDPTDLLLFSLSPNFIQISKKLINELRSQIIAMMLSEIMGKIICLMRHPLFRVSCTLLPSWNFIDHRAILRLPGESLDKAPGVIDEIGESLVLSGLLEHV